MQNALTWARFKSILFKMWQLLEWKRLPGGPTFELSIQTKHERLYGNENTKSTRYDGSHDGPQ